MEGFAAGGPPLTMRAGQPAECGSSPLLLRPFCVAKITAPLGSSCILFAFDTGPAYVYLASADSNFVSGSCLALTGGDMPFN